MLEKTGQKLYFKALELPCCSEEINFLSVADVYVRKYLDWEFNSGIFNFLLK